MDNYDAERASAENGWMWWNLFIGASAVAFGLYLVPDADEWWEFATIVIMGVFALVVVTQGVRSLIARRSAAARRESIAGREDVTGREAGAHREAGARRDPS